MLKLYKVDKNGQLIFLQQSKCLEKYISFNSQKNEATNDFEKDLYKLMKLAFYRKTMGIVRKILKINFN